MHNDIAEASRLLRQIAAAPRPAGGKNEHNARDACATFLREIGMDVRTESFGFSAFPGLVATPLSGFVLVSLFISTGLAAANGSAALGLLLLVGHLSVVGLIALASGRRGILSLPLLRRNSENLMGIEGAESDVRLWLVAHIDSKSQPISILTRAVGVTGVVVLLVLFVAMLLLEVTAKVSLGSAWYFLTVIGVAMSTPVALSVVRSASNGALDNATGVVAVLLAANALIRAGVRGFGVVITSAEELGLAGAHAFARGRQRSQAINCDSVDSTGDFLLLLGSGTRGGVARAAREAGSGIETRVREVRTLLGVLVDSVALQAHGWDAITLCKGDFSSLRRIHTPRDGVTASLSEGSTYASVLIRDISVRLLGDNSPQASLKH